MNTALEDQQSHDAGTIVVGGPLAWSSPLPERPRRTLRRRAPRWGLTAIAAAVVLVVGLIGTFVQLPYYSISPGLARQVNDLVAVGDGTASFPPQGEVLLTTVSLRQVNVWEAVRGWLDDDVDVLHEDVLFPPQVEDRTAFNLALMDDSKQTALVVALRHLGYEVGERGQGALVIGVEPGLPADGNLQPGDVIVAVDGEAVSLNQDAVRVLGAKAPGDLVTLVVRDVTTSEERQVQVALASSEDGRALLGVRLQTAGLSFDLPIDVTIDSGSIGGPSAGLAFTLAVLDFLSEGELTGGVPVAVTGTMDLAGNVGPVGGVVQKTEAVNRSDAVLFLVPASEYDDAAAHARDSLEVARVDTLQDALIVLARFGGNALALGQPGAAAA